MTIQQDEPLVPLVEKLELFGNITRLRILILLTQHPILSPLEIQSLLGIAASTISFHLGFLHRGKLINKMPRGKFVLYQLNVPNLHLTIHQLTSLLGAKPNANPVTA